MLADWRPFLFQMFNSFGHNSQPRETVTLFYIQRRDVGYAKSNGDIAYDVRFKMPTNVHF
jgi:hypothetical protein